MVATVSQAAIRARFKGIRSKGFCQNYSNRCPDPTRKLLNSLRSCHNAGGGPSGPAENGFNVLRTPKYNKPLGKVKNNFRYSRRIGYHPRYRWTTGSPTPYFSAFSRADSRDL